MLWSLTREAAKAARHDAEVMRFEFSNWDITSEAVISAMLGALVFITHDGSPVPLGVAAQVTQIAGLKSDYQNFGKLGGVTSRDHKALVHALFRQFDTSVSMDYFERSSSNA